MAKSSANNEPDKLDVALGLRIRQRRKALGISQTALADAVGITFQQIQKYERGFNRISFSRLVKMAHALNCRVQDLVGDLDDVGAPPALADQDTSHLRVPGAPELLTAFAEITTELRRAILKVTVEVAKSQRSAKREQSKPH